MVVAPAIADAVQITDYGEIQEILRSRDFIQGAYARSGEALMADTVTTLDGPDHLQRRRIIGKLFSEEAMASYRQQHLVPVIDTCLAEVAEQRSDDGIVRADLVPLVWRMIHQVAARITGIDGIDTEADEHRFIEQVRAIGAGATADWATGDPEAVIAAGVEARDHYERDFFLPSLEHRRRLVDDMRAGRISQEELPKDLLTLLLIHWDPSWSADLALKESSIFLVGSTQTSAQSMMLFILKLEDWFAQHPEQRTLIETDEDFLRRASFEALRSIVAAPARIRISTKDVVLKSGRMIGAGQRVALHFIPANREPERFGPHAESFDPFRATEGVPAWGLAFGGGAHACIGRPLVTGIGTSRESDGTMVSIARRLYAAGLQLDQESVPVADEATFYSVYESIPVRFTKL